MLWEAQPESLKLKVMVVITPQTRKYDVDKRGKNNHQFRTMDSSRKG